jgi:hypothetical protein
MLFQPLITWTALRCLPRLTGSFISPLYDLNGADGAAVGARGLGSMAVAIGCWLFFSEIASSLRSSQWHFVFIAHIVIDYVKVFEEGLEIVGEDVDADEAILRFYLGVVFVLHIFHDSNSFYKDMGRADALP